MPKVDITAALQNEEKVTTNRRTMARKATSALLGGPNSFGVNEFAIISKLRVQAIPYEKIKPREINEFSDTGDINSLAESIKLYGLINPLSVVHHEDEDIYVISAGHRRFKAIGILRSEDPLSEKYNNVDCAVYEVTDDEFKLAQGLPYITKEQEEGIYRDSNLENRQLSYEDVAKQIRYIIGRFDDPSYFNRIRDNLLEKGISIHPTHSDKAKVVVSVLSSQKYSGWSKEIIRQYLTIRDSGREDLLDRIENEGLKVSAAYKIAMKEANKSRKRKTNKITSLRIAMDEFVTEAQKRTYSEKDLDELRKYVQQLQEIIEKQTS